MAPARWSWPDRWSLFYNRTVARPGFRQWAAAFPLTRPLARKRAGELFDLCAGFVYSQILAACVRLDLFGHLSNGPLTVDELAQRLALPADSARRLLDGAVALRLVKRRRDGRYALGALGAPLVGNAAITAMVEHHRLLYADLGDPVALLRNPSRSTELADYWSYATAADPATLGSERVADYSQLMSASQPLVAEEALAGYRFARHQCVLDVGGGEGTFLTALAASVPGPKLMLFDLPPVAERARRMFAASGLADRAETFGGDFTRDPLPRGADLVTLVRVLHDHDDDAVMTLLRSVRACLPEHGQVLIVEPMSETPGAARVGDAYFGFYLLAMGSGRPRTSARLAEMLLASGFHHPRLLSTRVPLQTRLLTASVSA